MKTLQSCIRPVLFSALAMTACGGDPPSGSSSSASGAGGGGGDAVASSSSSAGGAGGDASGGSGGSGGGEGGAGGTGGAGGAGGGSSSGIALWSKSFGDGEIQRGNDIAVDSAGNPLLTGVFWGTIDFGGGVLTSAGDREAYVAKLSPSGDHLWSHRFGGGTNDQGIGVATDDADNVIVGGSFQGTVDFGGGPVMSAGSYDAFVVKLDAGGAFLWGKAFGAKGNQDITSVAADSAGNIVVAGNFVGTVDFGGGPLIGNLMYGDTFLVKLDPSGAHLWSKHFSSPSDSGAPDIAIDSSDNIVLAARLGSLVVAKLDASGAQIFSKDLPVIATEVSVAVDATGSVLLAGQFDGTADFGGGPLTTSGLFSDAFVAKLDPAGGHVWSQRYGDGEEQGAVGVAVDPAGNVLVTGGFDGSIDFGGGAIAAEPGGFETIFVAKLTPDGGHIWSRGIGNIDGINEGNAIAADALGHPLVTGRFGGQIDFGAGPITGEFENVFAAKLAP